MGLEGRKLGPAVRSSNASLGCPILGDPQVSELLSPQEGRLPVALRTPHCCPLAVSPEGVCGCQGGDVRPLADLLRSRVSPKELRLPGSLLLALENPPQFPLSFRRDSD